MKPGMIRDRNSSAVADEFMTSYSERIQGSSPSVFGIVGIRKAESRITITHRTRSSAWTTPRTPPISSSATVAFLNSDCLW